MKSWKEILFIGVLLITTLWLAKYTNQHAPVYRMPHHIPKKNKDAPKEINGVPLVIYQSWGTHEIPHHMANNIKDVLAKNPEFDYYLYSDEECRMFIEHNFPKDVVKAFDSLRPGAYKSDLWRYCILYVKGGVYMDIKLKPLIPLQNFIEAQPYVFVKDFVANQQYRECMWNGFMIAPPGFDLFKYCIEEIVSTCKRKSYMRNGLDITGPCLLGRMVKKHQPYNFLNYNMLAITSPKTFTWNTDIVMTIYKEYREEQKTFQKTEHYAKLWTLRKVYHE
jgi:mannosyltransferase OCH1-like enzyme